MTSKEVVIGGVYRAKVNGHMRDVRINRASSLGGWYATNIETGREVFIRSPRRLRRVVSVPTPPPAREPETELV